MSEGKKRPWIEEEEFEDANIKWNWSYFDGRGDGVNETGKRSFMLILPKEKALAMREAGWDSVKELDPYEEGDEPEWVIKVMISYRFEAPKIYLIKNDRRFLAEEKDVSEIRRDACEKIDLVISPKPWTYGTKSGVTAYVKELYATIRESRFEKQYADYEMV
jgi:hypothetical protein